jgi:ribosomal protein L11 methyltransferase
MNNTLTLLTIENLDEKGAVQVAERLTELFASPPAVAVNEVDAVTGRWNVVAYCEDASHAADAARFLQRGDVRPDDVSITAAPEKDWVSLSLQGLPPIRPGRFFIYGAHDRGRRTGGGIALEIGAGLAFGTGHHGTTAGCLAALDELLKRSSPRRVLDLGCGTGILAIAAAKALRRKVVASDIDDDAVQITRANAALNSALPLVKAVKAAGTASPHMRGRQFDLVFANILARPLIQMAGPISQVVALGGTLILSGMTEDQVRWVIPAYRNRGLRPVTLRRLEGWATVTLTRQLQ